MTHTENPRATSNGDVDVPLLCSACFQDQGLKLYSRQVGIRDDMPCPNCRASTGHKLDRQYLYHVADRFFVGGTLERHCYGASPLVQCNEHHTTDIDVPQWLARDMELIGSVLGIGFFYYDPRLWMIGEVEPLKALRSAESRNAVIDRIIDEYRERTLEQGEVLYRLRKDVQNPTDPGEFDSPPSGICRSNRFESRDFPVLYASPNLQTCVHECRVTAEDDLFVATLSSTKDLKLLDLSPVLEEDGVTEFESLDIAVHMLFLAGQYSYGISRRLAKTVYRRGYDGIVYPSYFSLLQTGAMPFETAYGISLRRLPGLAGSEYANWRQYEEAKMVPNVALFGRPIEQGVLDVTCINRLILRRVQYEFHYGPVIDEMCQSWGIGDCGKKDRASLYTTMCRGVGHIRRLAGKVYSRLCC